MKRWDSNRQLGDINHRHVNIPGGWSPQSTRLERSCDESAAMERSSGRGKRVYLSEALCGEPVGLMPQDDRYWTIHFGPLKIGLWTVMLIVPCIHLL